MRMMIFWNKLKKRFKKWFQQSVETKSWVGRSLGLINLLISHTQCVTHESSFRVHIRWRCFIEHIILMKSRYDFKRDILFFMLSSVFLNGLLIKGHFLACYLQYLQYIVNIYRHLYQTILLFSVFLLKWCK